MTTEIEKQFFETFGINGEYYYNCDLIDTIEPDEKFMLPNCSKSELISFCKEKEYYSYCKVVKVYKIYPQITDRILLELICIVNEAYLEFGGTDVETMKNSILDVLIFFKKDIIKHKIQELFKGENK